MQVTFIMQSFSRSERRLRFCRNWLVLRVATRWRKYWTKYMVICRLITFICPAVVMTKMWHHFKRQIVFYFTFFLLKLNALSNKTFICQSTKPICTCVIDVYFQWNVHILGVFSHVPSSKFSWQPLSTLPLSRNKWKDSKMNL